MRRSDAAGFAIALVASVLAAQAAGLVWAALAPQLSLAGIAAGSQVPFRAEVGADGWFLVVTATAGVLAALVAVLAGARGPGTLAGLATGGLLGALVAARVGGLATHEHTMAMVQALGVSVARLHRFGIDPFLQVRAQGVLVAWPLAAVVAYAAGVALSTRRR